jgi:ribosomal protein S21
MQQKKKRQLQAGLINEMRERKLYDTGTLDD